MIILETMILSIGLFVNSVLIINISIHPILWSTINTFIGCFLFGNFLYLTFETFLIAEDVEADGKIYYRRTVRLGLWETFHNKPNGKIIHNKLRLKLCQAQV